LGVKQDADYAEDFLLGGGGGTMDLPTRLTFHNSAYRLDGGTTSLYATDARGTEHWVTLGQHAHVEPISDDGRIPGRLHFDGEAIAVRSTLESDLVSLLKAADVRVVPKPAGSDRPSADGPKGFAVIGADIKRVLSRTPEENVRALLADVIAFVESEGYVSFAAKVERADGTA
jgi:hypothetical protein